MFDREPQSSAGAPDSLDAFSTVATVLARGSGELPNVIAREASGDGSAT